MLFNVSTKRTRESHPRTLLTLCLAVPISSKVPITPFPVSSLVMMRSANGKKSPFPLVTFARSFDRVYLILVYQRKEV